MLAPLTRLLAAQLRELPLHQFPCVRRRLGIAPASPTAAGSAHGVWFVPYRTTDELGSQQPLPRNGRRDSGSVLGPPTPTAMGGPAAGAAHPGSAPATHHHLLEPDHPDVAPPDRSVLKDPFLHSGGHVLHDLLTDLHAMMQWRYADGEQVLRPQPRTRPRPRPAAKRGQPDALDRAWVSLQTHVLTLELSTAAVVPTVSRLLANVVPPQVEPLVAPRVIGAGDTTLPGASMMSLTAALSPVSLHSMRHSPPRGRSPVHALGGLAEGHTTELSGSDRSQGSKGAEAQGVSDDSDGGYSDDDFENDDSRVGNGATSPVRSPSPSRSTTSPPTGRRASGLPPTVSTAPPRRGRAGTGASTGDTLHEVYPMEAIVWQLMQQHADNAGLLVRCLTLLCTSSQWVVATGPQVPCVCGDSGGGGGDDGSDPGQPPAWHFLIPRRLFAGIMKRHSGSSTVIGVAALALAVGVLNTHRLAVTSSANERLARLMTPSASEVWDMVQQPRTAHRYDQLVMVRCVTRGTAGAADRASPLSSRVRDCVLLPTPPPLAPCRPASRPSCSLPSARRTVTEPPSGQSSPRSAPKPAGWQTSEPRRRRGVKPRTPTGAGGETAGTLASCVRRWRARTVRCLGVGARRAAGLAVAPRRR